MIPVDGQGLFRVNHAAWKADEVEGVHWYRGGPGGRLFLGYLVGAEKSGGISDLPPPSLQSSRTVLMYAYRDHLTCHLCGQPVVIGRRSAGYERLRPSPDHLLPKFAGGTDLPSNIRTAHLTCNKSRRNLDIQTWRSLNATRITHGGSNE